MELCYLIEDKIFKSIARSSLEKELKLTVIRMLEKNLFPIENRNEITPRELNVYVAEVKKVIQEKNMKGNGDKI